MQYQMQPPGPYPGPQPGQFPGQYPGPMPGQYPGPMPGQYPGGGGFGGGMGGLNFRDPATLLRIIVIALGALSLILLIAGTAVDEYRSISVQHGSSSGSTAYGCQKVTTSAKYMGQSIDRSCRGKFKYMYTLSFIIIFTTSILCLLQAAATALNVTVLLLGTNQKPALILSTVLTILLLVVIMMVNVNFSYDRTMHQAAEIEHSVECVATFAEQAIEEAKKSHGGLGRHGRLGRRKRAFDKRPDELLTWGHSYGLVCSSFAFAVINQILLIAIHTASGASTFGAFIDSVKASVSNPAKLVRLGIFLLNLLLFVLMVTGTAHDRYIRRGTSDDYGCVRGVTSNACGANSKDDVLFEKVPKLAIALFALTILICILLTVATALSVFQLIKDKNLTIPLLGLSGVSTVFTLASVVIACVHFKSDEMFGEGVKSLFEVSFNTLATSLAFGLVNAGLNGFNMFMSMKGGFGTGGTTSNLNVSSTQPSSVPTPTA